MRSSSQLAPAGYGDGDKLQVSKSKPNKLPQNHTCPLGGSRDLLQFISTPYHTNRKDHEDSPLYKIGCIGKLGHQCHSSFISPSVLALLYYPKPYIYSTY
jgi:hypothetical protein